MHRERLVWLVGDSTLLPLHFTSVLFYHCCDVMHDGKCSTESVDRANAEQSRGAVWPTTRSVQNTLIHIIQFDNEHLRTLAMDLVRSLFVPPIAFSTRRHTHTKTNDFLLLNLCALVLQIWLINLITVCPHSLFSNYCEKSIHIKQFVTREPIEQTSFSIYFNVMYGLVKIKHCPIQECSNIIKRKFHSYYEKKKKKRSDKSQKEDFLHANNESTKHDSKKRTEQKIFTSLRWVIT